MRRNNDPTEGRVYGGDTGLIHLADGTRADAGYSLAAELTFRMRNAAYREGERSIFDAGTQPLCPGCYMVVIVAMAVKLAQDNGQSLQELGQSLASAFADIATNGVDERNMEWIDIPHDEELPPQMLREAEAYQMLNQHFPGVFA